ncbi:MAG: hypothetical protein ACYS7Y_04050 [Planctomycetota bacterium]|jgi:hypothetical protein
MKLGDIKLLDLGYKPLPIDTVPPPLHYFCMGEGSDAESALDDLLHKMQVRGYDVGGLEGRIKDIWCPAEEAEGVYILVLFFEVA